MNPDYSCYRGFQEVYAMEKASSRLLILQRIDSKINAINNDPELEALIKRRSQIKEEEALLREEISSQRDQLFQKGRTIKKKDDEEQSLSYQENEMKEEMYSGRARAKEVEQLQRKIKNIKKQRERLEEEVLLLMEEEEELQQKIEGLDNRYQVLADEKASITQRIEEKKSCNNEKIARLEEEKRELLEGIEAEELEVYQGLKKKKKGVAVVEVDGSYCTGCRVHLPAFIIDRLYGEERLVFCESCGRILSLPLDG